ncbi:MAG: hypothetical protein Q8O67_01725 [Deltaproteobacteria bacterium]|nr:hypothetical protein [Deltaproteobacteria bacterium]
MSELPVIVGATRGRLPGDSGDQLVYGDDGSLVVYATAPIDGVLISQHRPCLLVVDDVRFVVLAHTVEGKHHVYRCQPWKPGPYDREGAVVDYDPDRLHHQRVERLHFAVRGVILFSLLPVMPLMGLLPENAKKKLQEHGLLPPGSQMSSLLLEWALALLCVAAELISIISGSLLPAAIFGFIAIVLVIDIPHRMVLAAESRDIGMFSWPRELWRAMRTPAPTEPPQLDEDTAKPAKLDS